MSTGFRPLVRNLWSLGLNFERAHLRKLRLASQQVDWQKPVIFFIAFFSGILSNNFLVNMQTVKELLGLSNAEVGNILLPHALLFAIGTIMSGLLTVWIGWRKLFIISLALGLVSQAAILFSFYGQYYVAFTLLVGGIAALGLCDSLAEPALNSCPLFVESSEYQSTLLKIQGLVSAGLAFSPLLEMIFVTNGLFMELHLCLMLVAATLIGVLCFLGAKAASSKTEENLGEQDTKRKLSLTKLLRKFTLPMRRFRFWGVIIALALFASLEGPLSSWSFVMLCEEKAFPEAEARSLITVFWFARTAGCLLLSWVALKYCLDKVWPIIPLCTGLLCLFLPSLSAGAAAPAFLLYGALGLLSSGFLAIAIGKLNGIFRGEISFVTALAIMTYVLSSSISSILLGNLSADFGIAQSLFYLAPVAACACALLLCFYSTITAKRR